MLALALVPHCHSSSTKIEAPRFSGQVDSNETPARHHRRSASHNELEHHGTRLIIALIFVTVIISRHGEEGLTAAKWHYVE